MGALDTKGFTCCVEGGVMKIRKNGKSVVIQGTKQGNLYILQGSTVTGYVSSISVAESKFSDNNSLWHMRLGHMSEKGLEILGKQGLLGSHKMEPLKFCEHCVLGKQHRIKFPKTAHTTKATLDYIHLDCWGLLKFLP